MTNSLEGVMLGIVGTARIKSSRKRISEAQSGHEKQALVMVELADFLNGSPNIYSWQGTYLRALMNEMVKATEERVLEADAEQCQSRVAKLKEIAVTATTAAEAIEKISRLPWPGAPAMPPEDAELHLKPGDAATAKPRSWPGIVRGGAEEMLEILNPARPKGCQGCGSVLHMTASGHREDCIVEWDKIRELMPGLGENYTSRERHAAWVAWLACQVRAECTCQNNGGGRTPTTHAFSCSVDVEFRRLASRLRE